MSLKKLALSLSLLTLTSSAVFTTTSWLSSEVPKSMSERIVEYLNANTYEINVEEGSKHADLTDKFTAENVRFLLPKDLRESFNDESLEIVKIVKLNGEEVTDKDLEKGGVRLEGYIVYNYENFLDQEVHIFMPVTTSDTQDVVDAISATKYQDTILAYTRYLDFLDLIITNNYQFITDSLSPEIQEKFNPDYFSLNDVVFKENGNSLEDSDFENYGVIAEGETWISFNYDNVWNVFADISIRIITKNEEGINRDITQSYYFVDIEFGNNPDDLINKIKTPEFIRSKIKDEQLYQDFDRRAYTFLSLTKKLDGSEITKEDLSAPNLIDTWIHYDYGSIKNQIASLQIYVTLKNLKDALAGFQVSDWKGQVGFLDANDLNILRKKIEEYLEIESFEAEGLGFDLRRSTSVYISTSMWSCTYMGKARITWNLKLFEVWGIPMGNNVSDPDLRAGLKVYFYIEYGTNLVKVYNIFGEIERRPGPIQPAYQQYHRFRFYEFGWLTRDFTFNGDQWTTDDVGPAFKDYDSYFMDQVLFTSPEAARVRAYDHQTGEWVSAINGRMFWINGWGMVNWEE